MLREDWAELMDNYIAIAMRRAHDVEQDGEAQYWKRVAVELKCEADVK